ncbi:MAG: hypothetical protein B5M49_03015 [Thermotoga sp. 4484_232]|nr:MAG: hypothetical protein B5M49_03015 [Thermotoga sp. 4484_232]HDG61601.1 DUF4040 domain-containing protein [Thermotoga sp.]
MGCFQINPDDDSGVNLESFPLSCSSENICEDGEKVREAIILLMLAISFYTVFQKRFIQGVLGRTALSILAVALYVFLGAPDVAIAEALLGALLTTFVYILVIKNPGVLTVGMTPVRILFEKREDAYIGLEYEVIHRFCREYGYTLKIMEFERPEEVMEAVREGIVDIGCGGLVSEEGIKYLETRLLDIGGNVMDILRYQDKAFKGEIKESPEGVRKGYYVFLVSDKAGEMGDRFIEFIEREDLKTLIKKYLGGELS